MSRVSLADAFRASLARRFPDTGELEPLLVRRVVEATAAWPADWIDPGQLVGALAERIGSDADPVEVVRTMHVADLYLALACACGRPEAIAALEAGWFPEVDAAIRRRCGAVSWAADFKQALREKLLVGATHRGPRIADYSGHGPLRAWLRVIVVRDLINYQTRGPREQPTDDAELERLPEPSLSPELRLFKQRYAPQFEQAIIASLAELPSRDRTLLQQRFVGGLTLEELATAHRVDRATVVRWLAKTRGAVVAAVRQRLIASTQLPSSEISSLMRHVQSGLQATLSQLLG